MARLWTVVCLFLVAGAANACDPDSVTVGRAPDGGIMMRPGETRWGQWWDFYVTCEGDTLRYRRARILGTGILEQSNAIIPASAEQFGDGLRRDYARQQLFIRAIGQEMGGLMQEKMGNSFRNFLRAAIADTSWQDSTLTPGERRDIAAVHWNNAYGWLPISPNALAAMYADLKGFESVSDMLDEIWRRRRHIE